MNIFKRLLNYFFPEKKKQLSAFDKIERAKVSEAALPVQPTIPSPPVEVEVTKPVLSEFQPAKKLEIPFVAPKPKNRWRMRNNRLHIQYNGSGRSFKLHGKIQSLRVTKFERAQEIVRRIDYSCIAKAIFQDKQGVQFKIIG